MKIKKVIICKEVGEYTLNTSILKSYIPKAGDVAIFEVLEIGKHDSIQSTNGNNSYIFPGDLIMNAFGNRYATGQFEGYVPTKYLEKYQILGKGGAVGELISMNVKLLNVGPTELKLIGYAVDSNGNVINTKYLNQTPVTFEPLRQRSPKIYLSIGSSMDTYSIIISCGSTVSFIVSGIGVALIVNILAGTPISIIVFSSSSLKSVLINSLEILLSFLI